MNGSEARIDQIIREYDAQGWHRTGTDVDRRSAEWLAGWVRACGYAPGLEPFTLRRIEPRICFIEVGDRRIEGTPLFDGGFTDAAGVAGVLGPLNSAADIGLGDLPPQEGMATITTQARRVGRHRAIVAVTRGRRPGLALHNAPAFIAPFGPPVLQVSSDTGDWLREQAQRGARARVTVHVERTETEAYNVTATCLGADTDAAPMVVMTPRSGWWQCASERGGGLVCWLELLRALHNRAPHRTIHFVATSGHELGHLGLVAYLKRRPELAQGATMWLHFGANIGAAQEGGERLAALDPSHREAVLRALHAHAAPPAAVLEPGHTPPGEARNIHEAGGRYISLVGGNAQFHLPTDRWPDAVDIPRISRIAAAFADAMHNLTEVPVPI